MFDVSWSEMLLIGAVALIVIGPKELPRALRGVGQFVSKIRSMAAEFQGTFNEAMREAEFDQIKKEVEKINDAAREATNIDFNPAKTIHDEVKGAIENRFEADASPAASPPEGGPLPIAPVEPALAPLEPPGPVVIDHPPAPPEAAPKAKRPRKAKADAGEEGA